MNKLGWILFIVVIFAVIGVWKRPKKSLVTIAPKQCMFHVDDHWSFSFQEAVIHAIIKFYGLSKDPDDVIYKMTTEFPEIGSVQAQVCSSDKICFYAEGLQPVFLLNNTHVVGVTGRMSDKNNFSEEVQYMLPNLVSQQFDELPQMVCFVQKISPEIVSLHTVTWQNADMIILSHRNIPEMQCITCASKIPLVADVQQCHELYQEFLASKLKKKIKKNMMIYDIRFKNQIIVRPGG